MIRAVLRNGVVHPIDPSPDDWLTGRKLVIDRSEVNEFEVPIDIEKWLNSVEEAAQRLDCDNDWSPLERELRDADEIAKRQMRDEWGLNSRNQFEFTAS